MRKALKTQRFQGFVYDAEGGKTGYEGRETGDPGYEIEFWVYRYFDIGLTIILTILVKIVRHIFLLSGNQ